MRYLLVPTLTLALFKPYFAQELPKEISLKPGEEKYCSATFRDLDGQRFSGTVRVHRPDEGDSIRFYVFHDHQTDNANTPKEA